GGETTASGRRRNAALDATTPVPRGCEAAIADPSPRSRTGHTGSPRRPVCLATRRRSVLVVVVVVRVVLVLVVAVHGLAGLVDGVELGALGRVVAVHGLARVVGDLRGGALVDVTRLARLVDRVEAGALVGLLAV